MRVNPTPLLSSAYMKCLEADERAKYGMDVAESSVRTGGVGVSRQTFEMYVVGPDDGRGRWLRRAGRDAARGLADRSRADHADQPELRRAWQEGDCDGERRSQSRRQCER